MRCLPYAPSCLCLFQTRTFDFLPWGSEEPESRGGMCWEADGVITCMPAS